MNTNYSKIALLLALGVAAGEVGATQVAPFDYAPMKDLPSRRVKVTNEYSALNTGLKNVDDVYALSRLISELTQDIISKNGAALRVSSWLNVETGELINANNSATTGTDANFGKLLLGAKDTEKTATIKAVFASEHAVDQASVALSDFVKKFKKGCDAIKGGNLSVDISDAFTSMPNSTTNAKEAVNKWIAKTNSESKLTEVVSGLDTVMTKASRITVRTAKSDVFVRSVHNALYTLNGKVQELGLAEVMVENNEKIPLKSALDNIVIGLIDAVGHFSKQYIGNGIPNVDTINTFKTAAERKLAVQTFANSINTNGVKGLGKILSKVVGDDFISEEKDGWVACKSSLDSANNADAKGKEILKYLTKAFGEAADIQTNLEDILFAYTANIKAANANFIIPSELQLAFGSDATPTISTATAQGDAVKDGVFKNVGNLTDALSATGTPYNPQNSYDAIKVNRKSDSTTKLPDATFDLDNSKALPQVKARPQNAKKIIAAWTAETRASSAADTKQMLQSENQKIDKYLSEKSEPLFGKVQCTHSGIAHGLNKDQINDLRQELKTAYDAAIAALGDTAPQAPTQVASTTGATDSMKAIDNVVNYQQLADIPGVKSQINDEILNRIAKNTKLASALKGMTDANEAKAAYTQMFNALIKVDGKPAEAHVATLKALFPDSVQGVLDVKDGESDKQTNTKQKTNLEIDAEGRTDKELNEVVDTYSHEKNIRNNAKGDSSDPFEEINIEEIMDPKTGKLNEGQDEIVDTLLKAKLKELIKENKDNEGNPASLKKLKVKAAKDLIDKFSEVFQGLSAEAFEDEDEENAEAAKAKALKTATAVITQRVHAAFGLMKKTTKNTKTQVRKVKRQARRVKGQARRGKSKSANATKKSNSANATKKGSKTAVRRGRSKTKSAARNNVRSNSRNNAKNNAENNAAELEG